MQGIVFRRWKKYWIALSLENGLVGQGITKDQAVMKLKEATDSYNEVIETEEGFTDSPVTLEELFEFLTVG